MRSDVAQAGAAASDRPGGAAARNCNGCASSRPTRPCARPFFAMPAFRGPNGQFDQATFETVLRNNGLTEPRFLDMMRWRPGAAAAARRGQCRRGDAGRLAASTVRGSVRKALGRHGGIPVRRRTRAAGTRPRPSLQRWYDNHPDLYSVARIPQDQGGRACRRRHWRRTSRSPTTICSAAYDQHKVAVRHAGQAFRRSDLGARRGQGRRRWPASGAAARTGRAMQKAAQEPAARRSRWTMPPSANFPTRTWHARCSPQHRMRCPSPAKGALGWHVVRVTKVTPGQRAEVRRGEGRTARTGAGRKGRGPDV